jgi:hypothetical protein
MQQPKMRVLSLGVGTQSTAIYFMSALGYLPRIDYAIFADPGAEGKETYKYFEWLQEWALLNSAPPIIHCGRMSIFEDIVNGAATHNTSRTGFVTIPAFTKNEKDGVGMLRRQCTGEYKVVEVQKAIRKLYGLKYHAWTPITEVWKGITTDELERQSNPDNYWEINVYPLTGYKFWMRKRDKDEKSLKKNAAYQFQTLLFNNDDNITGEPKKLKGPRGIQEFARMDWGMPMTKAECIQWMIDQNLPVPPKSACIFCPYQSNSRWRDSKENRPEEFAQSVELDHAIRDSVHRGIQQPAYLHKSCKPLDQVDFDDPTYDLTDLVFGECSGNCGT